MTNEKKLEKIRYYAMNADAQLHDIDDIHGASFDEMLDTLDDAKDDMAQAIKIINDVLEDLWQSNLLDKV